MLFLNFKAHIYNENKKFFIILNITFKFNFHKKLSHVHVNDRIKTKLNLVFFLCCRLCLFLCFYFSNISILYKIFKQVISLTHLDFQELEFLVLIFSGKQILIILSNITKLFICCSSGP